MKIIVTGANGFIGRNIVKKCIDLGHIVHGISLHTNNLIDLLPNMTFTACDMSDIKSMKNQIVEFAPDVIIHCAWWGGNKFADTNHQDQFHKNIPPLVQLMDIVCDSGASKFVGLGSAAEYGRNECSIKEFAACNPDNLYGATKNMAKIYTEQICKQKYINWLWVRPFYTYGPYDIKTRLIPKTIIACLKNEKIVLNDCEVHIDYFYIDDFVNSLYDLIVYGHEGIINICSGYPTSVKHVINQIKNLTNSSSEIIFDPTLNRKDSPKWLVGNNYKLCLRLNPILRPVVLSDGLLRTINFYKNTMV